MGERMREAVSEICGEQCMRGHMQKNGGWTDVEGNPLSTLTCHLQANSSAAKVTDAHEARVAAFIGDSDSLQPQGRVALHQQVREECCAVGKGTASVPALSEAVHQLFGVCQLPDEVELCQTEARLQGEGAAEGGISVHQGHHRVFRDLDLHSSWG